MSAAPESLALAVAAASADLQRAIANRYQAKKARRIEFSRYTEEWGEDGGYYPHADHFQPEDIDADCENAIATLNGAQAVVAAARGAWRRATTKYVRAGGAA